jgi:hypothetical protein
MAITITAAYVQAYERTVRQLAQQSQTKLRDKVMERGISAEKHNWDRLGKGDFAVKAAARTATPATDSPWSRRVSVAGTRHDGDTVEPEDIVQMLIDPKSSVAEKQGMGAKRAVDDIIITAATGNALDGAGAPVVFPPGQKIGDGTTPISFDFVTAVQEKFMQNDIDPSIAKCFVVGPTQVRKLMQLTEQTSSDYVNAQALQTLNASGIVPNWMGFTWVMSTRLLIPSAGELSCLAFTKRAIGLQVNKDIWARVAEDPSISFAWRIYSALTMGAVRVEDEQIVHLHVKNSLT